ncbi:MAG: PAS domain-containing protein, partial [Desulfobacterales bacterium]|nr:PAS domain-containing protein [Desulfobacterales bacterium]
ILEDLPVPVIGVSVEGMIVLINQQAQSLSKNGKSVEIGKRLSDYFSNEMEEKMDEAMMYSTTLVLNKYRLSGTNYHIDLTPLSGKFSGKGVVMSLREII